MPGNVYHIIGPPHYIKVFLVIEISAITGGVVTRECIQIRINKALIIAPQSRQGARRHWEFDDNCTFGSCGLLPAFAVKDLHVIARDNDTR
ncbi:unannotated protein [freshwater metagenome]|uniref:Unannotated protein n=1 Tax=freshwater metagenome TaxID=449393 RepID=A0A6J6MGY8_9ZZZZ